ncbi:Tyrosyl-dna phosphodiesterase [Thalictrum thalictroides]|uniref:Tyrosyl-dna phosphodiesterase n=1 Tax=Thalictrum thalictroides TaxID=46969 RepID=A0A7J6UTX8_THATH|nr:Tyrosyl-dna phosphodiesterase [Thalictrum thalictroides]
MSWSCSECTYLNPPSQKLTCRICLTPSLSSSQPSPSSSTAKWSCKACTFANQVGKSECDICGTRASASLISDFEELDSLCSNDDLNSKIGSVFYPLQACKNKRKNQANASNSESDDGFCELGNFRSAKSAKKEETLMG